MPMQQLQPSDAEVLISSGGLDLVDIRSAGEFRRAHLKNAKNIPADHLDQADLGDRSVLFYCRTGLRTDMVGDRLAKATRGQAYVLKGGIDAWDAAGLPVERDQTAPLPLERQVQLTIGMMLVIAMALSVTLSPWFGVIPALIGCGLIIAGATGFCGLGLVMAEMPWNRT